MSSNLNPDPKMKRWSKLFVLAICLQHFGHSSGQPRIIGGYPASSEDFPFYAFIQFNSLYCGGAIINPLWIISAAHCAKGNIKSLHVVMGIDEQAKGGPFGIWRHMDKIFIYEKFDINVTWEHDILLLKVNEPIKFFDRVQPISLPTKDEDLSTMTDLQIVGFGTTNEAFARVNDRLMAASVSLFGREICLKKAVDPDIFRDNIMICAGEPEGRKDACWGDSGGPLVGKRADGTRVIIGIVSFGWGCGKINSASFFTRVSAYVDWIDHTIKNN